MSESGEKTFLRFCDSVGLQALRVLEASSTGERRPDFSVVGSDGSRFYAEVKRISPTQAEADYIRRYANGETFAMGGIPGGRMRGLIAKANRQLKGLVHEAPGVLVVFNPEFLLSWHTEPYSVLTAMRGLDVVDVSVANDPREVPLMGKVRSGPKKRMTRTDNTSTAAVICPRETGREWLIDVYHNRFAASPLQVSALSHATVRHWAVSEDERDWTRLPLTST